MTSLPSRVGVLGGGTMGVGIAHAFLIKGCSVVVVERDAEAAAIAYAQQGVVPPRPLTHDLLVDVIAALGRTLSAVHIVELKDGVFYAQLVFDDGVTVSSRTSDGIALALRTGAPLRVGDAVIDEAGIQVSDDEDDEVERFRAFLDQVSAEDFDQPGGPEEPGLPEG